MTPSEVALVWAVPAAIAVHNLEEALWLPAWSARKAGRWSSRAGAWEFRFAVVVLTGLAILIGALTQLNGWASPWHYLLGCYALGQAINVFIPHAAATVVTRSYAPGLATGALLVLPAAALLLHTGFAAHQLQAGRFALTAAVFLPALVLSIPVLFHIGRWLHRTA